MSGLGIASSCHDACPRYWMALVTGLLFLFINVAAYQPEECIECRGLFDVSVVVAGTTQLYESPFSITRTISYTQLYWAPSYPVTWTGRSFTQPSSSYTVYDEQVLESVTTMQTLIGGYTSIQWLYMMSKCISLTSQWDFDPPLTIGGSDAWLTGATDTVITAYASAQTEQISTLILNDRILQSIGTTCGTPSIWRQEIIPTSASECLASTFVPVSVDESSEYTRLIVSIILGVGFLLWLAFLGFFILHRRALRKVDNKSRAAWKEQKPLPVSLENGIGDRMPAPDPTYARTRAIRKKLHDCQHWKAPLIMLFGLVCGLAFAIGHHLLYQSINGRAVASIQTSQTWFLRIGNLLAILVKLAFSISIGVAFVQLQWLKLRRVSLRVEDIDALSSVLTNILNFLDCSIWIRFPGLTLLAILFWLTALAPIFTPGTLNVGSLIFHNTTYLQVPQIDFLDSSRWIRTTEVEMVGDLQPEPGTVSDWAASIQAKQIAVAAAVGQEILSLTPYLPNGTYHLEFSGPAIKCINASTATRDAFSAAYGLRFVDGADRWLYASSAIIPLTIDSPFHEIPIAESNYAVTSFEGTGPLRLYIARSDGIQSDYTTFSVMECGLYNANYSVQFSLQEGKQNITILDVSYLSKVSIDSAMGMGVDGSSPPDFSSFTELQITRASYYGLMIAFSGLVAGYIMEFEGLTNNIYTSIDLVGFDYLHIPWNMLQNKIEELFQNMTISTLSNPIFHKNATTADWIRVDNQVALISYTYNSLDLVITYGLAFVLTQVCVLIGLYAVIRNDGSYQNRFSTFLRATRNESEIRKHASQDDNAKEPRPKELAKAIVKFFPQSNDVRQSLLQRKPVPVYTGLQNSDD